MLSFFRSFVLFVLVLAADQSVAREPVILVLGDSLSAAYSMDREEAWTSLLQGRINEIGMNHRVFNSSITGDTTQGGLTRLPRLLEKHQPQWVIIELGGNDGLRGIDIAVTRANLAEMVERSQNAGARVVLAGIRLPPNYGQVYTTRFESIFPDMAEEYGTLLISFFMEGVALDPAYMQNDGIHPNVSAQPLLLDNVWNVLGPALAN